MTLSAAKILEWKYLVPILFLLILLSRLLYLDADPSFIKRVSDISDEAIWGLDARSIALTGEWPQGEVHFGLDSAPLYTLILTGIFKFFGSSLFTLRVLAALSGTLTAVIIYFFVKKLTSKKQALLALAFYAFGEAPFIYNRLGHIESTLALFLLLMFICFYQGNWIKSFIFLSGLCYGLAFLTKFTALFFAPAIVAYWFYEYYQKQWHWKKLVHFSLGAVLPIVVYFIFFLLPNWQRLSQSMLAHGNNNLFLTEAAKNLLKVLGNNLFAIPTVMILLIFALIYALYKLSSLSSFTLKQIIENLTPLEAISLSWIMLGTAGALLSDLSDRRFTIMLVPAAILASQLIIHFKGFSLKEIWIKTASPQFFPSPLSKYFYFLLLLLPFFSLPYVSLRLLGENTAFFQYGGFIIFISYLGTAIILSCAPKVNHKLLIYQFLFFAAFTPFTVLLRHFTRHLAVVFSLTQYEKFFFFLYTAFFFLVFLVIAFILYRREKQTLTPKPVALLTGVYFAISFLVISQVMLFPQFTTLQAAKQLSQVTIPGSLVFGEAMEVIYGTDLNFIFYLPYNDKFSQLNKNIFSLKPRYFVYSPIFDGLPPPLYHQRLFEEIKEKYSLTLLSEMELYPYPLSQKHKIKLQVYEIKYS